MNENETVNAENEADTAVETDVSRGTNVRVEAEEAEPAAEAPEAEPTEETAPDPLEERASALDARERELARREVRLLALDALDARGLPPELLPALPLDGEPGMRAALDGLELAFRRAVESSLQKRMAGAPPTLATGAGARDAALRRAMGLE